MEILVTRASLPGGFDPKEDGLLVQFSWKFTDKKAGFSLWDLRLTDKEDALSSLGEPISKTSSVHLILDVDAERHKHRFPATLLQIWRCDRSC